MDLDDFREGIRLRYLQDSRTRDKIATVVKLTRALDESHAESNKLRVINAGQTEAIESLRNTTVSLIKRNGNLQERWDRNRPIKWFGIGAAIGGTLSAVGTTYLLMRH